MEMCCTPWSFFFFLLFFLFCPWWLGLGSEASIPPPWRHHCSPESYRDVQLDIFISSWFGFSGQIKGFLTCSSSKLSHFLLAISSSLPCQHLCISATRPCWRRCTAAPHWLLLKINTPDRQLRAVCTTQDRVTQSGLHPALRFLIWSACASQSAFAERFNRNRRPLRRILGSDWTNHRFKLMSSFVSIATAHSQLNYLRK